MQDYVIGVDIGGTNIKMGAVDYQGTILDRRKIRTEAHLGSESIFSRMQNEILMLQKSVTGFDLKAIGFGIPGAIRRSDGVLTQAPNIPVWDGLPILRLLEERLRYPCYIDNDANAIALGEAWVGAGRGYNHVCCLTLGTGVGGGVLIAGELLRGAEGMAAELGHISVEENGAPCNCGSRGCLETFASANGIIRILKEELAGNVSSSLSSVPSQEWTPQIVFEHAESGDAIAKRVLERAGNGLGVGLASLVNTFNPEVLVIGGGVAAAWNWMIPPAIETMKARAFQAPAEQVKIVRAEKEDDAGIYGSAYLAWDSLQRGETGDPERKSITPWGSWEVLEEGKDYKVKRLYIRPGHRLSYQKHEHRQETWMIAQGEALVVLNGKELRVRAGETIHIGKTDMHRIGNPGDSPLIFFEVQRGTYFGEDDIVRLEDDYKRT